MWGLPLYVIIPLAVVVLEIIALAINMVVEFQAGTPMTKEEFMAELQKHWEAAIGLGIIPELGNYTWPIVGPLVSVIYDIVVGLMIAGGSATKTADGKIVFNTAIDPKTIDRLHTTAQALLKIKAKLSPEQTKALDDFSKSKSFLSLKR